MPGHQIRFNDTLDDLGWMGEEAFVLRLFHRQKESRSLLHSVRRRAATAEESLDAALKSSIQNQFPSHSILHHPIHLHMYLSMIYLFRG